MTAKARRRKLTPFLCHEMLYEYECGFLDADRRAAVEEFLKDDAEGQSLLESIRRGLTYADKLAKTELNKETLVQLRDAENVMSLGRRYSSWRSWPETVRWSLTAIIISASVASVVAAIPWKSITFFSAESRPETVELAKIPILDGSHSQQDVADNGTQAPDAAANETEGSGDAADGEEVPIEIVGKVADANQDSAAKNPAVPDAAPNASAQLLPVSAPKPVAAPGAGPPADEPLGQAGATDGLPANERKEAKPKGFVYRAFMTLADLPTIAPKVTEEIRALGGEKAGEVELGWKRGTGHYYHFAMPQVNEEKLLEKLRAYGPVRISKDPHPRVMPEGQVRFILWIESAD